MTFFATLYKRIKKKYIKFKYAYQLFELRLLGANIGANVRIHGKIYVHGNPENLTIGDNCSLNEGVLLNCRDKIWIDERCHISAFTQIHSGALILDKLPRVHRSAPVYIGKDVWIAAQCIINPGVSIADKSVIGGNSTVTKSIEEENVFYAGNPATFIRVINY